MNGWTKTVSQEKMFQNLKESLAMFSNEEFAERMFNFIDKENISISKKIELLDFVTKTCQYTLEPKWRKSQP